MDIPTEDELTEDRTPLAFSAWLRRNLDDIYYSGEDGIRTSILYTEGPHRLIMKRLYEEALPLAILGENKFGDSDQVSLRLVLDDPTHDAVVTDRRANTAVVSRIEITQSHEGEDSYWRRLDRLETGRSFPYVPVPASGKKKGQAPAMPAQANPVEERVRRELQRIIDAAKRKEQKDYPADRSLLIFFDDWTPFHTVMDGEKLDEFVFQHLMTPTLRSRFTTLYLVGMWRDVFREFPLAWRPQR